MAVGGINGDNDGVWRAYDGKGLTAGASSRSNLPNLPGSWRIDLQEQTYHLGINDCKPVVRGCCTEPTTLRPLQTAYNTT